jgi:hypothetical protein
MNFGDAGGEHFGRYLLRDLIGKGGTGQIFRATSLLELPWTPRATVMPLTPGMVDF